MNGVYWKTHLRKLKTALFYSIVLISELRQNNLNYSIFLLP